MALKVEGSAVAASPSRQTAFAATCQVVPPSVRISNSPTRCRISRTQAVSGQSATRPVPQSPCCTLNQFANSGRVDPSHASEVQDDETVATTEEPADGAPQLSVQRRAKSTLEVDGTAMSQSLTSRGHHQRTSGPNAVVEEGG